jgi:hypothetical protein
MRRGTKSLLFGYHQVLLHPWFVLWGWHRVYGLGRGSGLWGLETLLAVVIHDWGYWGCHTMDGADGERHPERCARAVLRLLGCLGLKRFARRLSGEVLRHSRFYAEMAGLSPNRLCWADKAAVALMPGCMWALLTHFSGEGYEYMDDVKYEAHNGSERHTVTNLRRFHCRVRQWFRGQMDSGIPQRAG